MIRDTLAAAVESAAAGIGLDPAAVTWTMERPARREHGDWSCNIAMASAKAAGRAPRDIAGDLVAALEQADIAHVDSVEIAGPGFVNFRLTPSWLHDVLVEVVEGGTDGYARPDVGAGTKVNIEFVSANPNGPLHAGHGRGAAYGDSVARIMERTGFDVTREFYLNDRGVQMARYAESLLARKRGEPVPKDGYGGEYVADWAAEMPDDVADAGIDAVRSWGYDRALADQREVLAAFHVHFDVWSSEQALVDSGAMDAALADLRERGHAYDADGATWLRSTEFGDDKDRPLLKSDGDPTYLLPDIAYHRDKFARGFDLLIDVWGADHHGYVPRMRAGIEALGHDPDEFEVPIVQIVRLEREGKEVRLSKRAGDIIELRDLIDEVGADVARLTYLLQSVDSQQAIDLDLVTSRSNDNPVFYVQYAHARIHSIMGKAAAAGIVRAPLADADLSVLTHEREIELLRTLSELPEVLTRAARERAPHTVTNWVRELADRFHGFYHDCYVIGDVPADLTQARLWLVDAARVGFAIGLDLLGVSAPESM
ncbi:arginine--tRNA ligase [Acidimicrobiia bacterium EGI L10123]|uniref:arginine--tRNA ligase n=1 Tax=Salinilacustrithrix flava TaxID=2957203 RepID=UPI003D7C18C1|nr:arginine--tRNA ligase [Acidimicrobiia bacterium EGI L10123]